MNENFRGQQVKNTPQILMCFQHHGLHLFYHNHDSKLKNNKKPIFFIGMFTGLVCY